MFVHVHSRSCRSMGEGTKQTCSWKCNVLTLCISYVVQYLCNEQHSELKLKFAQLMSNVLGVPRGARLYTAGYAKQSFLHSAVSAF